MSDTGEFVAKAFAARHKAVDFQAGVHPVPVTGKVFGEAELSAAVEAALDFWLTSGPYTTEFEKKIAKTIGGRHAFMVNSGSSANCRCTQRVKVSRVRGFLKSKISK